MDDDKKNSISASATAAPILDVPVPVGSALKEQGPIPVAVSEVIKSAEPPPEISPDIAPFVQTSQPQIPTHQIIRASGENVPVTLGPTGIIQLPTISTMQEAVLVRKTDGATSGIRWQAETRIKQILRELRRQKKAA